MIRNWTWSHTSRVTVRGGGGGGTGSDECCGGSSLAFVIADKDCVFAWGHLANASPLAVVVLADPFSELCLLLLVLLAVLLESQLLILLLSFRGHVGGCVNAAVPSSIGVDWCWQLFAAVVVRVAASSLAVDD